MTSSTPHRPPRAACRRAEMKNVVAPSSAHAAATDMRLDKWLWAARLYKTRALAAEEIDKGRVQVNGQPAKPARAVRVHDRIGIRQQGSARELLVLNLSTIRGPAPVARELYRETEASVAAQQQAAQRRLFGVEPAAAQESGRPTKRDRRDLADWQRWSASVDDL